MSSTCNRLKHKHVKQTKSNENLQYIHTYSQMHRTTAQTRKISARLRERPLDTWAIEAVPNEMGVVVAIRSSSLSMKGSARRHTGTDLRMLHWVPLNSLRRQWEGQRGTQLLRLGHGAHLRPLKAIAEADTMNKKYYVEGAVRALVCNALTSSYTLVIGRTQTDLG